MPSIGVHTELLVQQNLPGERRRSTNEWPIKCLRHFLEMHPRASVCPDSEFNTGYAKLTASLLFFISNALEAGQHWESP